MEFAGSKNCHRPSPSLPNLYGNAHLSAWWIISNCDVSPALTTKRLLWPPYVIGQAIIFLPCGFFFFLLSCCFLAYSQPSQIGCLPYFHTWCGLSANLGCRSETWCTRLAENTGLKKSSKIRYLRTTVQLCRATSSQLRQYRQSGKKFLSSSISPTCPHNTVNFSPPAAEIASVV